jgi:hypothetical protein
MAVERGDIDLPDTADSLVACREHIFRCDYATGRVCADLRERRRGDPEFRPGYFHS